MVSVGTLASLSVFSLFVLPAFGADTTGAQLSAMIEKAKPKLGVLTPRQEEAFQEEVLSSSGRFVRDYKTEGARVVSAEIDFDSIKRYLSFNADDLLKGANKTTLLAVRAPDACVACAAAAPTVRKDLQARFGRRGLDVVALTPEESRRALPETMAKKNAIGWILAEIREVEDPEHPGENKIALQLGLRFPGTTVAALDKPMEILSGDDIPVAMSRLAVDALSDLGTKANLARIGAMEAMGEEGVELRLSGITDFPQVAAAKRALQAEFKDDKVVERRLSRSLAVLAIIGKRDADEVARQFGGRALDGGVRLQVTSVAAGGIDAVFRQDAPADSAAAPAPRKGK